MNKKISVVVHTLNNEEIIRDCLESVKDFDEIIVCDMYSSDKTLEIAKEYNAKIIMHEKTDYVEPARNFAISHAQNDWVLIADSDERITPDLRKWLYEFLENPKENSAVKIPRLNNYWGKVVKSSYPDYVIRFINKNNVKWRSEIHSQPIIEKGSVFKISSKFENLAIIHYTSKQIKDFINMVNKYTDFEVEKLAQKNAKVNIFAAFFKSFFLVFEKFLLKKGYKDGARGFILCAFWGFNKFLAYAKYWEYLQKKNSE